MLGTASANRSFRALLGAHACSNLGDGIRQAAFPLLAATLTRDPILVAGLTTSLMLPALVFGLPAGAIADRVDRRRLLMAMTASRATLLALLAASVVTGTVSLPLLYVIAFLTGTTETFFDSTAQVIVPAVVDREALEPANARLAIVEIVGNEFVGPLVGGLLFGIAVATPFVTIAALAVVGAVVITLMEGRFRPSRDDTAGLLADIRSGLRWLARHEVLRVTAAVAGLMAFVDTAAFAVLVLYAAEILGIGAVGFGALIGVTGAGGVLGSLLSGRYSRGRRVRPVMLLAVTLLMTTQLGLAATGHVLAAAGFLFLGGAAYGLWGVISLTLRQRLTPDAIRARASAGHRLVAIGSAPLGAAAGGLVAATFGLRATYAAGGIVLLCTLGGCALLITQRRLDDAHSRADAAAAGGES